MKTKFIKSVPENSNAISYYFELPNESFTWVPGQYTSISFEEGNDSHDNIHWFTIASGPESKEIQITTRMTGSIFKNKLNALKKDDVVIITEPQGDFVWKEADKPVVMIAGGIGITPYHSILTSTDNINAHLIYVNRDDQYVFKEDIDSIKSNNPNLEITYLTGAVTKDLLEQADSNIYKSIVYLSGPEPMVEAVGNELIKNGLPENNLVRDWFPGYDNTTF